MSAQGGVRSIVSIVGKGERLVTIHKNGNTKSYPFCGAINGHETLGLLKFALRNELGVTDSPKAVRLYRKINPKSLTNQNSDRRANRKAIAIGHLHVARLIFLRHPIYAVGYFLRYIKYLIRGSNAFQASNNRPI